MTKGHLDYKYSEFVRTMQEYSVWPMQLLADLKQLSKTLVISSCLNGGDSLTGIGEGHEWAPLMKILLPINTRPKWSGNLRLNTFVWQLDVSSWLTEFFLHINNWYKSYLN